MLGRFLANAEPRVFLGPFNVDRTVELVSRTMVDANTPGGLCWVGKSEEQARRATGYPLEPGTKVEVDLYAGEVLWGVAGTTALLGYSVKGYRGVIYG